MYPEEKETLNRLSESIYTSIASIDLDKYHEKLETLKQEQCDPSLYQNFEKIKEINMEISRLESIYEPWIKIKSHLTDVVTLLEIAEEENDNSLIPEIKEQTSQLEKEFNRLEIFRLFKDQNDQSNCYLTIHSGAGGTESCDWAMMLFRMYQRWSEGKGFQWDVLEYQDGEEAGIKSATILVKGDYAFGLLKSESGVHRLVRISPFDANKRRHTSFASISSAPEIINDTEVIIKPSEVRIDTYRASGAGGQHVNTTDSAVRLTHIPTNIVVSCQAERSQLQNKETAFKILKGRLYQYYQNLKEAELSANQQEKKKIEWGSQIRSYVFHPYNMVKDHRSQYETTNVAGVMGGDLDPFINIFLKQSVQSN